MRHRPAHVRPVEAPGDSHQRPGKPQSGAEPDDVLNRGGMSQPTNLRDPPWGGTSTDADDGTSVRGCTLSRFRRRKPDPTLSACCLDAAGAFGVSRDLSPRPVLAHTQLSRGREARDPSRVVVQISEPTALQLRLEPTTFRLTAEWLLVASRCKHEYLHAQKADY